MREDSHVLECLEDIHYFLEEALKPIAKVRSIHVSQLEHVLKGLRGQRRILEELSPAARIVVEHLLESELKGGQVAVEAEHFIQDYAFVRRIHVEEFSLIKVLLGGLEISWRDGNYTYYFYPDKVELRAVDEKSAIKLFFSRAFSLPGIGVFPELLVSPNVAYIHPQLEKWLKEV